MRFYFKTSDSAVIRTEDTTVRVQNGVFIDLGLNEATFIEILPACGSLCSPCYFTAEQLISSPPPNVTVTNLSGAYSVYAELVKLPISDYAVIYQNTVMCGGRNLVTVYRDRGLKLFVESNRGSFATTLNDSAQNIESGVIQALNAFFCSMDCDGGKELFVFDQSVNLLFRRVVTDYDVQDGLSTTIKLCDGLHHILTSRWKIEKGMLTSASELTDEHSGEICERIIPYLFFECFMLGDLRFADENIRQNSDKLSDFLGNYVEVFSPPHINADVVGLKYRVQGKKNLLTARYFRVDVKEKLITNIIPYSVF